MRRPLLKALQIGLPLLLCALPAAAHNGRVVLAYPVENITLDGDLSDWPANLTSYPIDTPQAGPPPRDVDDFEGSFRVGYNLAENAFYLAIKIRDESIVLDGEDWVDLVYPSARDACTPIINLDQDTFDSAVNFYPTWPVVVGDERHAMTAGTEVAFARDDQAHYYEWRVSAGQIEDPMVLSPGHVIGLMVGLWDRDADGSSSFMSWGGGYLSAPAGQSDVVLVDGATAQLTGAVQWPDQSHAGYIKVRIQSLKNPQTWVQVETDAQGFFAVELPVDDYRVEALGQHAEIALQPDASQHVVLTGYTPQGQELEIVQRVKKATPNSRQGPWQSFGLAQGLDAREMYAVHHDSQDRMWFGALNSLIRYDGREFVYFSTTEGSINFLANCIAEDRHGNIWFGSFRGVFRYDGENFVQFTTQDGLLDDVVYAIYEDGEGYLWFGSEGGASRYDGERFVHITHREELVTRVARIAEDAQGRLYFWGFKGFSRYDGETFENFYPPEGSNIQRIFALHIDRTGQVWAAWGQGGITRFASTGVPFGDESFESIRTINGVDITRSWVTSIAEDHRGDLWFSILGGGVYRYDGEEWQHYGAGDVLGTGMVSSVYKDRSEGLWFTVGGGVLMRYDDYQFDNLTAEDGLSNSGIMTVLEDLQGHLWLGTKRDINHYDGEKFTQVAPTVGHHYWRSRRDSRGDLWFTSTDGVLRYDGEAWRLFTEEDGLAGKGTKGIVEDGAGHIWVADPGLSRYDGATWTSFTVADGLASDSAGDLAFDEQGDLWIGRDGGVDRFDGKEFTHFDLGEEFIFMHWGDVHRSHDGTMWFGSIGGLVRFDGEQWKHFTTADGLLSNNIKALLHDSQNRLWIGGWGSGVALFDGLVFQHMLQPDGLVSDVVQQIYERQNGQMAIATEAGLTLYQPSTIPPSIRLTDVKADRDYGPIESLEIPSSQNYLRFEFQGASLLTSPERMAYVYRLRGFEGEWQVTREVFVEYGELPRGDFTFEIKAVDRDLNYSEPIAVEVQIHLPYERIGWISSLSIAFLLIAWQTRRIVRRDRALHQSNQLLEQKTNDLEKTNIDLEKARSSAEAASRAKSEFLANISHEIRTPMNAILGYAQLLRHEELSANQRADIERIQASGHHLLELINEVLDLSKIEAGQLRLNEQAFDLNELIASLDSMFSWRCKEKGLGWELLWDNDETTAVRGDASKLTQVLINLLSNAVKFSDAGVITLRIVKDREQRYLFEVQDTGVGISEPEQAQLFQAFQQGQAGMQRGGTGLGLIISRQLVELMGGQLQLESAPGEGTLFSFAIVLGESGPVVLDESSPSSMRFKLKDDVQLRALVADDVEDNREILRRMLEDMGLEVELAKDGREALEKIEKGLFDIVFLDIRMPVMDGREVVRLVRARREWPALRIVAVSASVLDHERSAYLKEGFDDFVGKPFEEAQIAESLRSQLQVELIASPGEGVEATHEAAQLPDLSTITLPTTLHAQLLKSAKLSRVTEIDESLREIESLGVKEKELADYLRIILRRYDTDGIVQILEAIPHD